MSNSPLLEPGQLFVVSAPSGTGKTTVVERLVSRSPQLSRSRSYTSRPPRAGETLGVDYNFVSREGFEEMVAREAFLEWADIFGHYYGTALQDTQATLATGKDLVLVIDVQGARQVRGRLPGVVAIFILPPSFETLAARLRGRNKDASSAIERRLATARNEIAAVEEYDYVVVNDDVDRCVREIDAIVTAERARLRRRRAALGPILDTFR